MDYVALEKALRALKTRTRLYNLLKAELSKHGHWKQKPRGKGFKKGYDKRRNK